MGETMHSIKPARESKLYEDSLPLTTPSLRAGIRGLSEQQQEAFNTFQSLCAEQGLLVRPAGLKEEDSLNGINDEASLFRFFAACRYDVHKAYEHFHKAYETRNINKICEFYEDIDVTVYQKTAELYPQWTGRRDKRGLPLYILDISKLTSESIAAHRKLSDSMPINKAASSDPSIRPSHVLCAYAVHDNLTRLVMPLCSAISGRVDPESPITKQLIIADISSLGLRQLWRLKDYVKNFSDLLALSYPEVLDRVLIIGAPSYISFAWDWVKSLVDPVTVAKLQLIAPEDVSKTLTSLIDVANIPKRYGGEFDFKPGMLPILDDEIRQRLTWAPSSDQRLPTGPIQWVNQSDKSMVAVAVGSVEGEKRRYDVATLK